IHRPLMRRLPVPAPAGSIALVTAASLALFRPPGQLADLLFAGLAALLCVDFALCLRSPLGALRVRRRLPRCAARGESIRAVHEVHNPSPRLLRGLRAQEEPPPGSSPLALSGQTASEFPALPGGARAAAGLHLFAGRRGPLRLGPLRLTAEGPFALFARSRTIDLPAEVLVHPRPRTPPGLDGLVRELSRALESSPCGEWERVREYRPGDPLRSVRWRLSARRGAPVVTTAPPPTRRRCALVLDLRQGLGASARTRFERAVALAAGLGVALLERGVELRFGTTAAAGSSAALASRPPERLRGRAGRDRLLSLLALVSPAPAGALPPWAEGAAPLVVSAAGSEGLAGRWGVLVLAPRGPAQPPPVLRSAR
ncbi:MAG: DUF58 domain-containing protein, partial [Planctomycetota bacterium]